MQKIVLWGAIAVGAVLLLALLILLLFPRFLNTHALRGDLEGRLSRRVGHPVDLGEDFRLTLFPEPRLVLRNVRIEAPSGSPESNLLAIRELEARIRLWPLVVGQVKPAQLRVQGFRMVVERTEDGRTNWDPAEKSPREKPSRPPREKQAVRPPRPLSRLSLWTLAARDSSLTDGTVLWVDRRAGKQVEIREVHLRVSEPDLGGPLHVSVSGRLGERSVELKGTAGPLGSRPGLGPVPMAFTLDLREEFRAAFRGQVSELAARPRFDLHCRVDPFSPRKLLSFLGQTLPWTPNDPDTLQSASLKARLQGTEQEIRLSEGDLELDGMHVPFSLRFWGGAEKGAEWEATVDRLDLDRYLPPHPEASSKSRSGQGTRTPKGSTAAPKAASASPGERPQSWTVPVAGQLKASQLKFRGAWIRDLEARLDARAGEIRLDPIRMEIFGGRVAGAVGLDLRGDLPQAEADLRTEHLQAGPLLREVARADFLEGSMDGRWVLRAHLGDREELKRSLEGWGEATVAQGALVGVDLVSIVRSLGLSGREPRSREDRTKTPFSSLSARFQFSKGAVKVSQASMTASGLRITAEGQADLLEETLDFRLEPELGGGDPKKKGEEQSAALVVPVWVRGTFSRPKFRPDLGSVHTKGEGKLRLQIPSSKELKDLLKGLLDRK